MTGIEKLEGAVRGAFGGHVSDEADIHSTVDQLRPFLAPGASDDEIQQLKDALSASLLVTIDRGVLVASPMVEPWLEAARNSISWKRWKAYEGFLLHEKKWPSSVVAETDTATDRVLDLMGDPSQHGAWRRRGLVLGDVQSGKTSTYLALLNKAADAGFRIIILLTGQTETLRRQTQARVDEGFIGVDTKAAALKNLKHKKAVGVGLRDKSVVTPVALTTRISDFRMQHNQAVRISVGAQEEKPHIFVLKKNKRVLDAVNAWLASQHAEDSPLDLPLLILDDESDYASVNTSSAEDSPTAINDAVRKMLSHSSRTAYVAFTATPFANIFIDSNEDDDLFPADFVLSLEAPSNYFGPDRTFNTDATGDVSPLVSINDAESAFPPRHKRHLIVTQLPRSLHDAIRAFVLVNALRDRLDTPPERSMLINVTRFRDVQAQVYRLVEESLERIRNAAQFHAHDASSRQDSAELAELQRVYESIFPLEAASIPWSELVTELDAASETIEVQLFNSDVDRSLGETEEEWVPPQRMIAVGGDVLSRGLTLEGLTISYFYRTVRAADTLLQMARWFGYRPAYDHLCRVWIPDTVADDFRYVHDAISELRLELARMHANGAVPRDFGLMVKKHPESLLVTARNKSRNTQEVKRTVSLIGRNIETRRLSGDSKVTDENLRALRALVGETPPEHWRKFSASRHAVASFLDRYRAGVGEPLWFGRALATYVRTSKWELLDTWDVWIRSGEQYKNNPLPTPLLGEPWYWVQRQALTDELGDVRVSGQKLRLAGSTDVAQVLSREARREVLESVNLSRAEQGLEPVTAVAEEEYYTKLKRPVLMLYPLTLSREEKGWDRHFLGAKIALPDQRGPRTRVAGSEGDATYIINRVAQEAWFGEDPDLIDQGDDLDE